MPSDSLEIRIEGVGFHSEDASSARYSAPHAPADGCFAPYCALAVPLVITSMVAHATHTKRLRMVLLRFLPRGTEPTADPRLGSRLPACWGGCEQDITVIARFRRPILGT